MDFNVNFMDRATAVLKEAFQLKKYKAMPLVLAIFVGIFMLPVVLISAVLALLVYVFGYLFSVSALPVQSLHHLLRDEGQQVKHGTQVIVYLLAWGVVFAAYITLTVFMISLTVLYTLFSIFTFLWTLGGFKFHLFAKEEDISVEVEGKYKLAIPVIFVAVMGVLLVVVPAFNVVSYLVERQNVKLTFELLTNLFRMEMHNTDTLRLLVSLVYSAALFAPNPKKIEK